MKKFYMQVNPEGYVTDLISYPYGDYVEIEYTPPLPDSVIAGWYRFIDGEFVLDEQRRAELMSDEAEQ